MKLFLSFSWLLIQVCSCATIGEKPHESDLAGSVYRVKPRDSLASIASTHKVSEEEIRYINGLDKNKRLRVGQVLFLPDPDPIGTKITKLTKRRVQPPKQTTTKKLNSAQAKAIFSFPVPGGQIVNHFSSAKKTPYDGIGIKAKRGTRVNAALDGRVLFVGDDGTKFGLIIIVEHAAPFMSVYAHLDHANVSAGQTVKSGQQIGQLGQSGGVPVPHLHFQIRVDQKPKDPRPYLSDKN